jgi:UTP--glucose-1-phosphate uridylyltransferase
MKEQGMKKIRKAVFPVAGLGTRFLPATKAMPKELLPIIDKPLIQYAAEEAISAGIDTLIFVTGRNKRALEDHFDSNLELEASLLAKGKKQQADMIRNILPQGIECIFVRQPEQLGLGHAILCAERAVGNEAFTVLLADDFIIHPKKGVTNDLIKAYETSGKMQLSVMKVIGPEISNYGVVRQMNSLGYVNGLIEKPKIEDAPSNLASIGRYVLTESIFDALRELEPGANGEIQLADAINKQALEGNVQAVVLNGNRYDCGNIEGYIKAVMHNAKKFNYI